MIKMYFVCVFFFILYEVISICSFENIFFLVNLGKRNKHLSAKKTKWLTAILWLIVYLLQT